MARWFHLNLIRLAKLQQPQTFQMSFTQKDEVSLAKPQPSTTPPKPSNDPPSTTHLPHTSTPPTYHRYAPHALQPPHASFFASSRSRSRSPCAPLAAKKLSAPPASGPRTSKRVRSSAGGFWGGES